MIRYKYIIAGVICLILAALWTFWPRHVQETGKSEQLPPAKEVRTVEKIIERVKYVKVYPLEIKEKLKLPDSVIQKTEQKVIATGKLDAEDRPYTMSAVLDTNTGNATIYARPDPLPWLSYGKRGAVGVAYGIHNGNQDAMIYVYRDLLQVKSIHAGIRAEAMPGDYFVGGYIEYRF